MFYREAGVFKSSYAADMALYPLPVSRWGLGVLFGLAVVVVPLFASDYVLSILNLILVAVVGAIGLNILTGTSTAPAPGRPIRMDGPIDAGGAG